MTKYNEERCTIGVKLKQAREYLVISQEDAATAIDLSRSALSLIENGRRKLETFELMGLAKLYQRPIAFFTEENFSAKFATDFTVLARNYEGLSENDQKELIQFAEFLAMKEQTKNDG